MNRKINKKGFTLTEILAVIAILGVILAIAVPSYNSLSKKFEKAYYEKLEGSILAAAKSYYKENAESRPAELLYSNVVTFSELIDNKNIDDIKGYKSESNLKGRIIIVKKLEGYDYKMCYLEPDNNFDNNKEYEKNASTTLTDEDLLKKLGTNETTNTNNCDLNWLNNNKNTFIATYGNTEAIYLYYSETNNPKTIKEKLGVVKTLTKISSSGTVLENVDLGDTKYYPENITAIDLRTAKERDQTYNLTYRIKAGDSNDIVTNTKTLYVVRYDAPDVEQSNGMVQLNWKTGDNEGKVGNLHTRFSRYQYREKTCSGKWNTWVDIAGGNNIHSFVNSSNICNGIVTAQFRWNDTEENTSRISDETEITITPKLDPSLDIKSFIDNDPNKLYDYNWTNKDVTIRLTAKDITTDNSIVNASKNNELIDVTIDDNHEAVKDVVVSENTKVSEKSTGTEYNFRLRDKDGKNLGLSNIQYIKIDKTKPLVDIKVTTTSYKELYSYTSSTGAKKPSGGMEWTNSAPRIYYNVFVKDELSGIDEVKITKKFGTISYNASGVQEQDPDEYSSVSAYKTYSENGYKRYFIPIETDMYNETITVTVTDKAGNSVSEETKIKYDKTPPSVVIEYTSVNVIPICFDNIGGSGKDKIYYKTSANASWSRYIILARDKNVKTYYAKCTDNAGNSSETSEPNDSTTTATYSITFNSNGGTGSMSPIKNIKSGETKTLTKNTFTREGYTFAGWSTSSGSSTVKYADGAQVKVTTSIQLYAVWNQKSVKTFTVTFDHLKAVWMSQTNTTKSCQTTGNSCQIKLENLTAPSGGNQRSQSTNPNIKKNGNNPYSNLVTVSGWYTNSNGTGTKYSPNATITVSSNMTLYAIVKTNKTRFYAFPNEENGLYCRKAAGQAYAKQNFKGMILTNDSTAAYYNSTNWQYTGGKMWFVGNVDPSNLCSGGSLGVGKVCTSCWVPGDWVDW